MKGVLKVGRSKIAKSFTCIICNDLFTDATTISECLDTFCKKCIYKKIKEEEIEHCPKCNAYLGSSPLTKLVFDYNLQSMRNKIFGTPEAKKTESSGSVPSAQLPPNPKKLSLSPLKISDSSAESKAIDNDKLEKSTAESYEKKVSAIAEEPLEPAGPKRSKRLIEAAKRIQAAKDGESKEKEGEEDDEEEAEEENNNGGKTLYLSELVKDSNRAKSSKSKRKSKKSKSKSDSKPGPAKPKETQSQEAVSSRIPAAQNAGSSSAGAVGRPSNAVWFGLFPWEKQEVGEPLPQMRAPYLSVKDGSMTVSTIKKYIVTKLNLASEDEVELTLLDQPQLNTTTLSDLIDKWIREGPKPEMTETASGSSAKEIVMKLGYARKPSPP